MLINTTDLPIFFGLAIFNEWIPLLFFRSERIQDKIYEKINILLNFIGKRCSPYQMKEPTFVYNSENSPLSEEDINLISSTNLSISEKHHLRMLAHCLQCFKSMSKKNQGGLIPLKEEWLEWCLENPLMLQDDEFVQVMLSNLLGQLSS